MVLMVAKVSEWISVEDLCERVFGEAWDNHPDYIDARDWVRVTFYDEEGNLKPKVEVIPCEEIYLPEPPKDER